MAFSVAIALLAQPTAASTSAPSIEDGSRIPAKTVVQIEITESLSSKTNNLGDTFTLKLAEPVIVDGRTILPAGLTGRGEVTHAAKRGWGGRPGELIINARYVDCGDLRISLGHLHFSVAGQNNFGGAFATSQVVPFGQFMVAGKDAVIPAGAKATAQVNADVVVPMAQQCALTG